MEEIYAKISKAHVGRPKLVLKDEASKASEIVKRLKVNTVKKLGTATLTDEEERKLNFWEIRKKQSQPKRFELDSNFVDPFENQHYIFLATMDKSKLPELETLKENDFTKPKRRYNTKLFKCEENLEKITFPHLQEAKNHDKPKNSDLMSKKYVRFYPQKRNKNADEKKNTDLTDKSSDDLQVLKGKKKANENEQRDFICEKSDLFQPESKDNKNGGENENIRLINKNQVCHQKEDKKNRDDLIYEKPNDLQTPEGAYDDGNKRTEFIHCDSLRSVNRNKNSGKNRTYFLQEPEENINAEERKKSDLVNEQFNCLQPGDGNENCDENRGSDLVYEIAEDLQLPEKNKNGDNNQKTDLSSKTWGGLQPANRNKSSYSRNRKNDVIFEKTVGLPKKGDGSSAKTDGKSNLFIQKCYPSQQQKRKQLLMQMKSNPKVIDPENNKCVSILPFITDDMTNAISSRPLRIIEIIDGNKKDKLKKVTISRQQLIENKVPEEKNVAMKAFRKSICHQPLEILNIFEQMETSESVMKLTICLPLPGKIKICDKNSVEKKIVDVNEKSVGSRSQKKGKILMKKKRVDLVMKMSDKTNKIKKGAIDLLKRKSVGFQPSAGTSKDCDTEICDLVTDESFLVYFKIFQANLPYTKGMKNVPKPKVGQGILLSSENTLADLRDAILCEFDYCRSSIPPFEFNKDIFPSGMFYINNNFYLDKRNPKSVDYSTEVKEWFKTKGIDEGETFEMKDTLIKDLEVIVEYPYLYQHLGDCEHFVSVELIRLLNDDDSHFSGHYPQLFMIGNRKRKLCKTCCKRPIECIVMGSKRILNSHTKMCKKCYEMFYLVDKEPVEEQATCYSFVNRHDLL